MKLAPGKRLEQWRQRRIADPIVRPRWPHKTILPQPGSLSVRFAVLEINLPRRRKFPEHSFHRCCGKVPPLVSKPDEEFCVTAIA
jgi:hypothetical protein